MCNSLRRTLLRVSPSRGGLFPWPQDRLVPRGCGAFRLGRPTLAI